jgi:hypothetical protein
LKTGTENRSKVIGAIVLGVLAVILIGRLLFSNSSPEAATSVPAPAATEPSGRPAAKRNVANPKSTHVSAPRLDPTLQLNLLKQSEDTKYTGSGRNIFIAHEDVPIPQPVKPPVIDHPAPTGPPPPPPPPPITLKFFGFANKPGEPKKVFLSQGEDVFIAGEGDIVDRRYRVLRIISNPASVEVEDVLNNNRQTIPLTQG